jgi:predicted DNA-binding transcriptional regulator AlpA
MARPEVTGRKTFHLDKRAATLAAVPGSDDELLSTAETAVWLGVSVQWLEIGRSKNYAYGPPFEKLGAKLIRYRRDKVRAWLDSRTFNCTSEYPKKRKRVA